MAELLFGLSCSTEICVKLFTRSSRNKPRSFLISLSFYQTSLLSSLQSRYMFDIKKLFQVAALKVIPRETRDDLLRITIDLSERSKRLPPDSSLVIFTILFQVKVKR